MKYYTSLCVPFPPLNNSKSFLDHPLSLSQPSRTSITTDFVTNDLAVLEAEAKAAASRAETWWPNFAPWGFLLSHPPLLARANLLLQEQGGIRRIQEKGEERKEKKGKNGGGKKGRVEHVWFCVYGNTRKLSRWGAPPGNPPRILAAFLPQWPSGDTMVKGFERLNVSVSA